MVLTAEVAELTAFDDYLRFGNDEERGKSERTRDSYKWTVDLFLRYLKGKAPTPDLAKGFLKTLEERGNKATTINRHIWALKSYFRYKGQEFKLRGLKTTEYYPRFLNNDEWEVLYRSVMDTIHNPDLPEYAHRRGKLEYALLMAYAGAGLRCSEAVNLKIEDVTELGEVRVIRKGSHEEYVPLEDEVLQAFKSYLAVRELNGAYLFPGKAPGSHLAERTAEKIIQVICTRAGLQGVHVHSLRHTAGYQLRFNGASERDIQEFLGHKNIATTKLYTHLVRGDLKARLPRRFNNAMQGRFELAEVAR